jgi:uncharacterized membrane protein
VDESLGTRRIEAFSDGIFGIAATLLILDVSVHGGRPLTDELLRIWPSYIAYVTSFLTIVIIWVNHHAIFEKVERTDRTLFFLNALLLLVVAFIPFPTRLVADFLGENGERAAVIVYGLTMTCLAIVFIALWLYVSVGRRLLREDVPQTAVDDITRSYLPGFPVYSSATALAFASPLASVIIYLALAVFFSVPPAWLRRTQP